MTARHRSMRRFSAILISGALASKVLGCAREVMMAHVLGATLVADGFRAALVAVLIPLAFLQNESVPAIMIPMHREAMERDDAPQNLGALTIVIGLVAAAVMVMIQLLGEWWVDAMVGGFCLAALLWAIGNALAVAWTDPAPEAVVIGALALGALSQIPLANITSGENGFLFWTFAVLLTPKHDLRVLA